VQSYFLLLFFPLGFLQQNYKGGGGSHLFDALSLPQSWAYSELRRVFVPRSSTGPPQHRVGGKGTLRIYHWGAVAGRGFV